MIEWNGMEWSQITEFFTHKTKAPRSEPRAYVLRGEETVPFEIEKEPTAQICLPPHFQNVSTEILSLPLPSPA